MYDLELIFKPPIRITKRAQFSLISTNLSKFIRRYQTTMKTDPNRVSLAKNCLYSINRAFTMGFIEQGEGIKSKINKLESDNDLLRDQLKACRQECQALEKKIEGYLKVLRGKGDKFVSNVE